MIGRARKPSSAPSTSDVTASSPSSKCRPSGPMPVGRSCTNSGVRPGHVVDADDVGPLGGDEQVRPAADPADLEALGLVALVLRTGLGVVAGPHDLVLERGCRPRTGPGPLRVEEREAATAALDAVGVDVVALVGGGERVVVDPLHGVRLAAAVGQRAVERDDAVALRAELLLGRVDAVDVDRPGGEVGGHRSGAQVDDGRGGCSPAATRRPGRGG